MIWIKLTFSRSVFKKTVFGTVKIILNTFDKSLPSFLNVTIARTKYFYGEGFQIFRIFQSLYVRRNFPNGLVQWILNVRHNQFFLISTCNHDINVILFLGGFPLPLPCLEKLQFFCETVITVLLIINNFQVKLQEYIIFLMLARVLWLTVKWGTL
mgnify:CR=1 FL=1